MQTASATSAIVFCVMFTISISSSRLGFGTISLNMNRSICASGKGYVPSCSIGFCVARTKNGSFSFRDTPITVTVCSCIASSSALCVFGVARLISSAKIMLLKIGPGWKLNVEFPLSSFTMMFVPVTSAGIRSGVNWMRENGRLKTRPSVRTRRVFPTPGTPSSSTFPPAIIAITVPSTTSFCPITSRRI